MHNVFIYFQIFYDEGTTKWTDANLTSMWIPAVFLVQIYVTNYCCVMLNIDLTVHVIFETYVCTGTFIFILISTSFNTLFDVMIIFMLIL